MEVEFFRWLMGGAFIVVISLLGLLWRNIRDELQEVGKNVQTVKDAVMLDMRGLDVRITWLEAHNGVASRRKYDDERTGG